MEFSAFVLNDDLQIPPNSLYTSVEEWLQSLRSSYEEIESSDLADSEVCDFVSNIRSNVTSSLQNLRRTQFVSKQYILLSDRISHLQSRLSSIKSRQRYDLYYSVWNQLQVFKGVRVAFKKHLIKLSVKMVDSFLAVDNLHEQFIDCYVLEL